MPLLSIPFTWDFPLHLCYYNNAERIWWTSFQFPLLGIFPCITNLGLKVGRTGVRAFNSLYLGFSLASQFTLCIISTKKIAFNSLYLGFSLASECEKQIWSVSLILSIPFTWDFPLHLATGKGL